MVITKENEKAPVLGNDIVESSIQRKQRRSGVVPEWNTTHTYTFAMHTPYVDLYTFRVVGLGLGNVDLSNFWGQSVAEVVAYSISDDGSHTEPKKSYLFRFCIENFPDSPILDDDGSNEGYEEDGDVSSDEEEKEQETTTSPLQVKAWIETYLSRKIEDRFLIVSETKDTLRTYSLYLPVYLSICLYITHTHTHTQARGNRAVKSSNH